MHVEEPVFSTGFVQGFIRLERNEHITARPGPGTNIYWVFLKGSLCMYPFGIFLCTR